MRTSQIPDDQAEAIATAGDATVSFIEKAYNKPHIRYV